MQQETQTSKPSAGAIVAIVGGIMLAIGSFLTWATVSVDTTALLNKLADTLGVSADQLQGVPTDSFSQSVSGWDGSDGKITLVVALDHHHRRHLDVRDASDPQGDGRGRDPGRSRRRRRGGL